MQRPFTIEEFARAWVAFKRAGPFPFTIKFSCEDGITRWLCASQYLAASDYEQTMHYFIRPRNARGPNHLYQQEQYIYSMQRSSAVHRALEELFSNTIMPRSKGHSDNDPTPYAEDFGCVGHKLQFQPRRKMYYCPICKVEFMKGGGKTHGQFGPTTYLTD